MYAKPGEANARETGWALRALVALYVETRDENGLQNVSGLLTALRYGKRSMATGLLHIRTILL